MLFDRGYSELISLRLALLLGYLFALVVFKKSILSSLGDEQPIGYLHILRQPQSPDPNSSRLA